jgi:hypothetical protein
MKFIIALIIGVAIGGYFLKNMDEDQRNKVGGAAGKAVDAVKQSKVGTVVSQKTSKATDQVADTVDDATDKVADTVDEATDKIADAADSVS